VLHRTLEHKKRRETHEETHDFANTKKGKGQQKQNIHVDRREKENMPQNTKEDKLFRLLSF
jgi:hypothetical protein